MSEQNTDLFGVIYDRRAALSRLDGHRDKLENLRREIERIKDTQSQEWDQISLFDRTIRKAMEIEATKRGVSSQWIVVATADTAFQLDADGDLYEVPLVLALNIPLPPPIFTAFTPPSPNSKPADDDEPGFEPEDMEELFGFDTDSTLTDEQISESAAYEAIHDVAGPDAADAWAGLGSPLNGHPLPACAATDIEADADGFIPASALGAMLGAARAQEWGKQANAIG
jgi:hypothetical protein